MSGGGGETLTQDNSVSPYEPAQSYLNNILSEASNLYQSGTGSQYYPGSTVVPYSSQTQQGLQGLQNLGVNQLSGSPMIQQAGNIMSNYAGGQAPSTYSGNYSGVPTQSYSGMAQLSPQQDYLSGLQSTIANQSLNAIQDQFGGMGRTGTSAGAQGAAQTAFTNAYAPIASQLSESERNRQLGMQQDALSRMQNANQFQTQSMMGMQGDQFARQQQANMLGQSQQMQAAGMLPGLQAQGDTRAMAGSQNMLNAGGAYEDFRARQLQEDMQRYQYEQISPYNRLQQYGGIVTPIASGFPVSQQSAQQPSYNALTGALGGGLAAGSVFAGNPWAALGGAALGGLGGFF